MSKSLFPTSPLPFRTSQSAMDDAIAAFWPLYYDRMRELHIAKKRSLFEPLKDRNLGTTASKHVKVFERFWCDQLARALGVPSKEVGPRRIKFKEYRKKSFDVCWPTKGDPKILVSVKSMQNAYRNMTNRVEEALGDSALLRLYEQQAAFGFFFFVLDGCVARGTGEIGEWPTEVEEAAAEAESGGDEDGIEEGEETKKGSKGVRPHLCLIEDGGDFFDLSEVPRYRAKRTTNGKGKGRQDVIALTQNTLLDLAHSDIATEPTLRYDSIAFVPTTVRRSKSGNWQTAISPVDPQLEYASFIDRLIRTAAARDLL